MTRPRSGRTYRSRPSRVKLALRRVIAGATLLLFIGVALALGVGALGGDGEADEIAVPTTTAAPPPPSLKIVFPEGFTRNEMIVRVGAVRNIAQRKRKITPKLSGPSYAAATKAAKVPAQFRPEAKRIEGFLFPATYEFTAKTTAKRFVAEQLEFFGQNWRKLNLRAAKSKNLTPYDVLIIASMIEKETAAPSERGKVAAVIYNRLKAGMPLEIDATIRYGLDIPGTEALRVSQLESDNPYNTRNRTGLPPTPIANPGLASMRAAARPADVDFLFYVRMPGTVRHFFTAEADEFFAKVCEYQGTCE